VWAPATGGPGALLVSPLNVKWKFSALAGGVEGTKLCLFSVIMPARCVSSVSPGFHYRRLTFCFLPLAAILESPPKLILYLNLGPIHRISHYKYANIPKSKILLVPSILDKGTSTYNFYDMNSFTNIIAYLLCARHYQRLWRCKGHTNAKFLPS
jgi:hypothetical protein